jgi:hypothetical protein
MSIAKFSDGVDNDGMSISEDCPIVTVGQSSDILIPSSDVDGVEATQAGRTLEDQTEVGTWMRVRFRQ